MVRFIFCIYILVMLFSCGKQHFPDYANEDHRQQQDHEEGVYSANLKTLNTKHVNQIDAEAYLWTRGNQFYARLVMKKGPARNQFQQSIHSGARCPDMSSDFNQDGLLDLNEVLFSAGERLIPLDYNLSSQIAGQGWFVQSNRWGSYYYSRATHLHRMLADLHSRDEIHGDGLGKLASDESLDLDRRIIVIYKKISEYLLPVACGEIEQKFQQPI